MAESNFGLPTIVPGPVDVIIVGGGLTGTLSAILLGRAGLRVSLIDLHDIYPPDFRAEQLVGSQVETLKDLGLLDILVSDTVPTERAVASRAGRIVGVATAPHYGILYDTMVNRARRHIPPSVQFIKAKVDDVNLTADRQRVTLSDGNVIEGRLVVLATGLGQRLLRKLGITQTTVRDVQSLTFGFDLQVEFPAKFRSSVLVAYGEQPEGAIDYLTIFCIENKLRGNLFTYGDHRAAWTKRFVQEPVETIRQAFPSLAQMTGEIQVEGKVQVRVNDLKTSSDHRCDGLILIGDAFQTSCPAAGTGIGRLLNDIDRLCNWYIPKWLMTSGMDVTKTDQFYGDLLKRRCDAEALRVADYRRSFTTNTGLVWKIHRGRVAVQNQLILLAQRKLRSEGRAAIPRSGMAPMALPPPGAGWQRSRMPEAEKTK